MRKFWKTQLSSALALFVAAFLITSCGDSKETASTNDGSSATEQTAAEAEPAAPVDPMENKGVGPVENVELGEQLDQDLVAKGQEIFEAKCSACHKFDKKYVGPALGGVTERRTPEWIMNMILNPEEMTKKDPIAQELLATYLTQMTYQDVTREESRALVEYFRQVDNK